MKEIPVPYVETNQFGIILLITLAIVLQQPLLLIILWIIQAAGLIFGPGANLFILISRPFLVIEGNETQAMELQRFNNVLGLIFLTASLASFALGFKLAGYLLAGAFAAAAFAALSGFCIGCVIYYQYKRFINRNRAKNT